jgi:hypothetical protein
MATRDRPGFQWDPNQTGYENVRRAVAPFDLPLDVWNRMLASVARFEDFGGSEYGGFDESWLLAEVLSFFAEHLSEGDRSEVDVASLRPSNRGP